jgi:hypothetical protein
MNRTSTLHDRMLRLAAAFTLALTATALLSPALPSPFNHGGKVGARPAPSELAGKVTALPAPHDDGGRATLNPLWAGPTRIS